MDLLIISLRADRHIAYEWFNASSISGALLFIGLIVGVISVIVSIATIITIGKLHSKDKSFKNAKALVKRLFISLPLALVSILAIVCFGFSTYSRIHNEGPIYNVSDYRQMRHLKKIYPKLPCKPYYKKTCSIKSLDSVSEDKKVAKTSMTKKDAARKYLKLERPYRKLHGHDVNHSRSLHPYGPRWYNWL